MTAETVHATVLKASAELGARVSDANDIRAMLTGVIALIDKCVDDNDDDGQAALRLTHAANARVLDLLTRLDDLSIELGGAGKAAETSEAPERVRGVWPLRLARTVPAPTATDR